MSKRTIYVIGYSLLISIILLPGIYSHHFRERDRQAWIAAPITNGFTDLGTTEVLSISCYEDRVCFAEVRGFSNEEPKRGSLTNVSALVPEGTKVGDKIQMTEYVVKFPDIENPWRRVYVGKPVQKE